MVSSITQLGRIGYYREITSVNRSVFYHGSITAIYALRILAFPITQRNLADAGGNVLVGSCKPKLRRYHDEYSTIVKNRVEYSRIIRNHFYFDYRIFIPRACHVSAISVIVEYIPATTLFPDIRRSSVERHTVILQPNALSVFVPFCHSFFTVTETTQNRFAKSSICSLAISRIKKY